MICCSLASRCSKHAWRGCLQAEVLDEHWIDFLAVVKNMETGAKLRFGTPQESLEEFRIESGAPMHGVHLLMC